MGFKRGGSGIIFCNGVREGNVAFYISTVGEVGVVIRLGVICQSNGNSNSLGLGGLQGNRGNSFAADLIGLVTKLLKVTKMLKIEQFTLSLRL